MAKMNAFIHDMDADIRVGDTMRNPRFADGGGLKQFDKVTANPMWNQKFPPEVFESDPYDRFLFGIPPSNSSSDWGWIQQSNKQRGGSQERLQPKPFIQGMWPLMRKRNIYL
jgi:type I restriction enzyme M protein